MRNNVLNDESWQEWVKLPVAPLALTSTEQEAIHVHAIPTAHWVLGGTDLRWTSLLPAGRAWHPHCAAGMYEGIWGMHSGMGNSPAVKNLPDYKEQMPLPVVGISTRPPLDSA